MAREVKNIGDLLNLYLRSEGLETPLNEYRIIASWGKVMGDTINGYTGNLYIRNSVLYVEIKSSVLRYELAYKRKTIVELLNKFVGARVINDVILR